MIFAIGNVGFLVGAALSGRIARRFGIGPTIIGSVVVSIAGNYLIPLAPRSGPIPFFIAGQLLLALGQPVYNINQVSFRQAITPHDMQGRMNATMRFLVWGTMPIGTIAGGLLATWLGIHTTLWIGAIGGTVAIAPLLVGPVRYLRTIPDPPTSTGLD